jgi:hypothetical protein
MVYHEPSKVFSMIRILFSVTAGFSGYEKTPINQAFSALQVQFYQRFTNVSGAPGLPTKQE